DVLGLRTFINAGSLAVASRISVAYKLLDCKAELKRFRLTDPLHDETRLRGKRLKQKGNDHASRAEGEGRKPVYFRQRPVKACRFHDGSERVSRQHGRRFRVGGGSAVNGAARRRETF